MSCFDDYIHFELCTEDIDQSEDDQCRDLYYKVKKSLVILISIVKIMLMENPNFCHWMWKLTKNIMLLKIHKPY